MSQTIQLRRFRRATFALVLSIASPAAAQTWSTTAPNGNWIVATNWVPTGVPASATTTVLNFGAWSGGPAMVNDIPGGLILNRINFTAAAPAYFIIGQPLDFRRTPAFVLPRIDFDASTLVTLNVPLTLTHDFIVSGTGAGTLLLSGQISGAGSLTMSGAGTLQLGDGTNSFSGGVVVSNGTLELTNGTAVPAGSNVTINGGQYNIGSLSNAAASALGTVSVNSGGTFRVPTSSGNYHITNLAMGGGTVDLTGALSFDLHMASASTGITVSTGSTWTGAGPGIRRLVNDTATPLPITFSNGAVLTSTIRLAPGASGQGFRVTGLGALVLNNIAGNTADLTVDGVGADVRVADMAALGAGTFTLLNQGQLLYTGASASSAKAITLGAANGGTIQVVQTGSNLTLTGVIGQSSAGQQLAIRGPGVLTLTGLNTYTGRTNIFDLGIASVASIPNGGVSSPLGASSNGPANLSLSSGSSPGTLQYTGPTATTNRGFAVNNPDFGGTIEVTNAGTTVTFTGQAIGPGRLVKTGPGTLVLSNTTNVYAAGTFVNGGTLRLGASGGVIPGGSNVTVATGGAFDTGGFSNFGVDLGTVTLNGGTFQVTSGGGTEYRLNRLVTDSSGGTVSMSGAGPFVFTGAGAGIAVNGNSAWTNPGGLGLSNNLATELDFSIAPGVTLTNAIRLVNGASDKGFRFTGGGTIQQLNGNNNADLIIGPARYRVSDVTASSGNGFITSGDLTFDGGTLEYTGGSAALSKPFTLDDGGGTLSVTIGATTLTLTSVVSGEGQLRKAGPGVLILNNPSNFFVGGIAVNGGRLDISADSQLGGGETIVNAGGILRYTANLSTSRTFTLNNGSLEAPNGLTLNGAIVNGGFLRGTGAYALTGGTTLTGVTTFTNTNLNVTGPASITNFSHNGNLTVNSGQTLTMNYGTNGSAARMTVNGTANVTEFVSNGLLTVPNGGLINNTGSNMVLGGGSTTFVGAVGNLGGKIDLGGQQLHVRGGLLVTNSGTFGSGNGVRNGVTVADYGALVKGTGPYQSVITQNGGQFLPGNSPGTSQVGDFFINPGGNLIFQITDAGPSLSFPSAPGIAGSNPGWGLTQVFTSMNFTATPASPYTITMQTQLPPPAAPDTPGLMSSFDPNRAYQWLIFDLQPGAVFNGTFDPNAINFATAAFVNPTVGGTFSLARTGGQIFLTFTPVPEPVFLLGAASIGGIALGVWRRSHPRSARC